MLPFEGLHAGQFVGRNGPYALAGEFGCLPVKGIDIGDFLLQLLVRFRRQPVTDLMRLKPAVFLKVGPHGGVKSR